MNTLVVYDSQFGNTQQVAEAIVGVLRASGTARIARVDPVHPVALQGVDLLILGSPTQGWLPTRAMQAGLTNLSPDALRGISVACFDTRFRKPRWMTGSAAIRMAKTLRTKGVESVVPPESFFVQGTEGPLESGEGVHAAQWAGRLHDMVATTLHQSIMG